MLQSWSKSSDLNDHFLTRWVCLFGVFGSWIPLIAEGDHEGVSPDLGLGAGKRPLLGCVRINFYFHQTFTQALSMPGSSTRSQNLNWPDLEFFWHALALSRNCVVALITVFTLRFGKTPAAVISCFATVQHFSKGSCLCNSYFAPLYLCISVFCISYVATAEYFNRCSFCLC